MAVDDGAKERAKMEAFLRFSSTVLSSLHSPSNTTLASFIQYLKQGAKESRENTVRQ
jgi:hypothetical protein